jgi:hypothetical protein
MRCTGRWQKKSLGELGAPGDWVRRKVTSRRAARARLRSGRGERAVHRERAGSRRSSAATPGRRTAATPATSGASESTPLRVLRSRSRGATGTSPAGGGRASDRHGCPPPHRTRSRSCSCSTDGTVTIVSSPAASRRASRTASRLSVLIRSVGARSVRPGAHTTSSIASARARRASPYPVGPASYTIRAGRGTPRSHGRSSCGRPTTRLVVSSPVS